MRSTIIARFLFLANLTNDSRYEKFLFINEDDELVINTQLGYYQTGIEAGYYSLSRNTFTKKRIFWKLQWF